MWSVTYYPNVPKQHGVNELVSVCWKFHRLWACVLFRRQERHPSVSVHCCCCYEYIFIQPKISPSPHYLKTERLPKLSETFKRGFWKRLPSTCAWLPTKQSIIKRYDIYNALNQTSLNTNTPISELMCKCSVVHRQKRWNNNLQRVIRSERGAGNVK